MQTSIFQIFHIFQITQLLVGFISFTLTLQGAGYADFFASANKILKDNNKVVTATDIDRLCSDCRLTSNSVDDLVRRPRQMNSYGQVDERVDLSKIKKAVCKDILKDTDRERCRSFYFTTLSTAEKWRNQNSRISYFDFVCIKELKYCCPENSFGQRCTKCTKCGPNERCHGEGTRSGNGTCVCKDGYAGPQCSSCVRGFYLYTSEASHEKNQQLCKPCHKGCAQCRGEGPTKCEVCNSGYKWDQGYGCVDVDECIANKKICGENTFCVNTEGSYFCYGK